MLNGLNFLNYIKKEKLLYNFIVYTQKKYII